MFPLMILVRRKSIFYWYKRWLHIHITNKNHFNINSCRHFMGAYWRCLSATSNNLCRKIFHTNIGILYTVQAAGLMIGSLLVNLYISSNKEKWKSIWLGLLPTRLFLSWIHSIRSTYFRYHYITLYAHSRSESSFHLIRHYFKLTHENMIGKVFSFHYSIYSSLIQLSMLMTGWLLEILSPQIIGSFLATCCIFVSFIWLFLYYRGKLNEESTIA